MDFLDKLVLPQSSEHIELLHFILMLIFFLFIPFISAVFAGAVLSVYYKRRGTKETNGLFERFSKDIIETVTINKSLGVILGIVPLLTAVIIYAQLLHTQKTDLTGYLALSFVLCSIGIISIYAYRYSLSFYRLFKDYKPSDDKTAEEFRNYREGSQSVISKASSYGIILLFLGLWLFTAAITLAAHPEQWQGSFINNIFNWRVIVGFGQYAAAAFAIAGAALLFNFFFWEGGKKDVDDVYKEYVRKKAIRITFAGALLQPVFIAINMFALPSASLSGWVFGFAVIALILLFLAYHFLYAMVKYSAGSFSGHLFYVLLFSLLALIVKDQVAMGNATKLNSAVMAVEYEKYLTELKGESGAVKELTGEEIFTNICSSCHAFDHKVVGPAYKDVLPKYEGKMGQLVAFVRNPAKVDPSFPPMPNPGLRPNQVEVVAKYIMETYKKK